MGIHNPRLQRPPRKFCVNRPRRLFAAGNRVDQKPGAVGKVPGEKNILGGGHERVLVAYDNTPLIDRYTVAFGGNKRNIRALADGKKNSVRLQSYGIRLVIFRIKPAFLIKNGNNFIKKDPLDTVTLVRQYLLRPITVQTVDPLFFSF